MLRRHAGPWALGSWITVGLGGIAAGAVRMDAALGPWIWILSGLVIGLAHGAGDAYDAPRPGWRRAWWLAGYGLAIVAAAWLAAAYPVAAVMGFVMLTIWHFGAADAHDLNHAQMSVNLFAGSARPEPMLFRWLNGAARLAMFFGATAMASPAKVAELGIAVAAVWPNALSGIGLGVHAYDVLISQAPWSATFTPDAVAYAGRGLLVLGGGIWAFIQLWRLRARQGAGALVVRDLLETVGLVALAWWLDPVFVVGLYFLGWHGSRHVARRIAYQSLHEVVPRGVRPSLAAVWRFHRDTAWLWMPIWPAWVGLVWVGDGRLALGDPMAWATAILAWFLVLTPVHHMLNERRVAQGCRTLCS